MPSPHFAPQERARGDKDKGIKGIKITHKMVLQMVEIVSQYDTKLMRQLMAFL